MEGNKAGKRLTTQNKDVSIMRFNSSNISAEVITSVLNIQKANSFEVLKDYSRGFLFTLWSQSELTDLINDGAELFTANDKDNHLCAYALLTHVRLLLKSHEAASHKKAILLPKGLESKSKYLYQIAVHPKHQGCGIGQKLLTNIESGQNGNSLFLDIMEEPHFNKTSFGFFKKAGYSKTSEMMHSDYRGLGACKWAILQKNI